MVGYAEVKLYVSESSNMSEGGSSSDRSGAGDIWEQSSGLRWQLVQEQEERIPGRSRSSSRRDGPMAASAASQAKYYYCTTIKAKQLLE